MVIILSGADTYRSLRRLQQLREAFRQRHDPRGLGMVMLDGDTTSEEELRNAIGSGGLFARRRLVVIDPYNPKKSTLKLTELVKTLEPSVKGEDTIVIIRQVGDGVAEKNKRAGRTTKKAAAVLVPGAKAEDFPAMDVTASERWIVTEGKARGGVITLPVARRLVVAAGSDAWRLNNELEKLLAYVGKRPVTEADVEALVIDRIESDVFRLTDAIGQGQRAVAMRALRHELDSGANPLAILAMLERQVRILLSIAQLKPESANEAVRELGLHPYVAQKSLAQVKVIGLERLRRWYKRLLDIDRELKSTPLEAETLLDLFLMRD